MLILISDAFAPNLPDQISRFGEVTNDKERQKDAEIVLVRSKTKCTKEYIDNAPNLKMIIRGGVGLDNIDLVYAKEKGIIVHNTASASAIAVAELAFALMLAVPNHIVGGCNSLRDRKWLKKEYKRSELYGKTLGLIGIGNIGTEVAKRAKAFGMNVIAYRKSGKPSEWAEVRPTLEEVLAEADYLSLHTPLTDQTEGIINKDTISKMKDGAVLVNTGRGKCVVEEDVVAALESGKLRGYGCDVWYSDPPPDECPVLSAPNVVMTPHLGASSKENLLRIGDVIVEKIQEYLQNK